MKVKVIYMSFGPDNPERQFEVSTVAEDHLGIMKEVWRRFNRVNNDPATEDCARLKVRSMACGDVIQYADRSFVIVGVGEKEITAEQIEAIRRMSATERMFKYTLAIG